MSIAAQREILAQAAAVLRRRPRLIGTRALVALGLAVERGLAGETGWQAEVTRAVAVLADRA